MSSSDLHLPYDPPASEGGLTVSSQVVAKLAGWAARTTYGVVAMQESVARRLTHLFRGSLDEGVEVRAEGAAVSIRLHVVMERGLNLAQVTANLQEQVRYEVERVGGLPVGEISVTVEDVRD